MIDTNAPISNKFNHCSLAVGGKHFVSPVEKHVLHFGCVPLYPSFLQLVCELFLLRQFHLSTEVVMFSRLYVELFIQFSWRNIQTDHLLYLSSDDIIRSLEQNGKLLRVLYTVVRSFAKIICNCSVYNHFNKRSVTKSGNIFPILHMSGVFLSE